MIKKILRIAGIAVFCFFSYWFMFRLFRDGFHALGIFVGVAITFVTLTMLWKALSAWRWLAAGLVMALLFTIYPIFYTFYLSFSNMSGGHLLTKAQAIQRLSREMYRPAEAPSWSWIAYHRGGDFMLVLEREDGFFTIKPGELPEPYSMPAGGAPERIDNYMRMNRVETMQNLQALGDLEFGRPPQIIKILSLQEVAVQLPVYNYDSGADSFTDNRSGVSYRPVRGTYTSESGDTLSPGFFVNIGWGNYSRFLGNPGYLKPVTKIFIWNICFSLFSVLFSFALGLMIALLFQNIKYGRIIRSLLIIPYPIPVLVSIMVWKALLNDNMGLVTMILSGLFGLTPRVLTNVLHTRIALILINVYLTYPYFYVLSSGALRSISKELFEAAAIDGASYVTVIRKIILPMLMRILAAPVIASFCFNFNNFTIIWGFNAGLPAMADTAVPMGYTDLLISFIYRLGFSSSTAADYGFSAAITVMLFIVVALMVLFQTLNAKFLKESPR